MTLKRKILTAQRTLHYAFNDYKPITVATSFGKDSMVLTHLVQEVNPEARYLAVVLDTDFDETKRYIAEVIQTRQLNCNFYFIEQRKDLPLSMCCTETINKTLKEGLKQEQSVIFGLRRDKEVQRDIPYFNNDHELFRVNPIVEFTETDVWRYLSLNNIQINPLYRHGYRSLGCQRCSTPETDIGTERTKIWTKGVGFNKELMPWLQRGLEHGL